MGVNGLWTVLQPCARPTNLATLHRRRLAVDASIWIYQFLKAVRDKEGNALRNSHVVGFFRRICKLLWFGIKPVFVFDGGAPALKRATLNGRRRRREGRRDDAVRTAGKLLAVQMQRMAEEEEERRLRRIDSGGAVAARRRADEEQEELPSMENMIYADELGISQQERQKTRKFFKQDAYHLPELDTDMANMGKPDDPRIMSVEELEEYARQFHSGEDINLYDFSKIDFDSDFFMSLPPADRYNILNAARLRSRLRMGLSKGQLDDMFPDRMAFSRFQIERVRERNNLTQRLMHEMGMTGLDLTLGLHSRIAGERNREYVLVKNEGADGGWALGVISGDKDSGQAHKPIDLDAVDVQYQEKGGADESDSEVEFEDVPIEGLNRLPKISDAIKATCEKVHELRSTGRQLDQSRQHGRIDEDEDTLFVANDKDEHHFVDQGMETDEYEKLDRAIAMSLGKHHGIGDRMKDVEDKTEERPVAQWVQVAVEAPGPIATMSGRMVAHVVNNRARAGAAVPRRHNSASSDSENDLRSAMAAARRQRQKEVSNAVLEPLESVAMRPNVRTLFDGPLPFQKLQWSIGSISKKQTKQREPVEPSRFTEGEKGDMEAESEDDAGGFVKSSQGSDGNIERSRQEDKNVPRSLPPWLADDTDIRQCMKKQRELDMAMSAEDEADRKAGSFRIRRQQEDAMIEIESSNEGESDVEFIDEHPARQQMTVAVSLPPGAGLPSVGYEQGNKSAERNHDIEQGALSVTVPGTANPDKRENRSPTPEEDFDFEDVALPTEPRAKATFPDHQMNDAELDAMLFGDSTTVPDQQVRPEGIAALADGELDDPNTPAPEEFDDFSDPEEEELLARMAEEAEEHARFASQLNNKTQEENHEIYEQELRALRSQQKKDRRDADEVTQVMVAECQALLKFFGIPYMTAPMEAEAQCAELVHMGLVDGIVTDDSDIFLFGGTRVYKNMFNTNKLVECYLGSDLEKELSLGREQLISISQLLGSDYTEGVPGVGPVTAMEILSEFPGKDGLEAFKEWWQDVQKHNRPRESDARSVFRRKFRKSHATKLFLPTGFPSPAVTEAYLQPEVDKSPEPFQWGVPDLDGLRRFLMSTIGWSQERTDEVLVPVIRDMNKREAEGTQSNITRYFTGTVGVGAKEASAPRQRAQGSKRLTRAVNKLRAQTRAEPLAVDEDAEPEDTPTSGTKAKAKSKRKRKATARLDDDIELSHETHGLGAEDGHVRDEAPSRRTNTGKGKGGKRTKTS